MKGISLYKRRVNRHEKMDEVCLTVWALGPFNLLVLGLLPATLYVCILNGAQLLLKSQEESSLQSKNLLPDDTHGVSRILFGGLLSLHVGVICTATPATPPPPLSSLSSPLQKKWSNGNGSKLRVNCFIVAAQQINKHLEAFRAAH